MNRLHASLIAAVFGGMFFASTVFGQAQSKDLDVSVSDVQAALKELEIEVDLDKAPPIDHESRWLGHKGTVIVELDGRRDNLAKVAVTAGFASDDFVSNAMALSALLSVIVVAVPVEERRPISQWVMKEIEKLEELPEDGEAKATYKMDDKHFEWTFWKTLGIAQLAVEGLPRDE